MLWVEMSTFNSSQALNSIFPQKRRMAQRSRRNLHFSRIVTWLCKLANSSWLTKLESVERKALKMLVLNLILGTVSNDDGDGNENVTNLHI